MKIRLDTWDEGKFAFKDQNVSNSPAYDLLKKGYNNAKELGLDCRIGAGTLLGLYRDKELISTDTDCDIELYFDKAREEFDEDDRQLIIYLGKFMIADKFRLVKTASYLGVPCQLVYAGTNDFVIDFSFFFLNKETEDYECVHEVGMFKTKHEHLNSKYNSKGQIFDYDTHYDIEGYLKDRYGKNWKTPVSGNINDWLVGEGVERA